MSKKTIIIIAAIVLALIGIIVGSFIYSRRDAKSEKITCTYENKEHQYNEKMEFFFVDGKLYDFTRTEKTKTNSTKDAKKLYDFYQTKVNAVSDYQTEDFIYRAELEDTTINVKTYIKVLLYPNVFNKYLKDMGINSKSSSKEVNNALSKNYKCNTVKR